MTSIKKDYQVIVNDFVFHFDTNEIAAVDLIQKTDHEFNCIHGHRSLNVVVSETESANKKLKLSIDGEIFSIEIKDELDQLIKEMGLGAIVNKPLENIKAPMPGLVLEINVTEGQSVFEGDKILILEAMKMENSIVIPANATIKKILVLKGQAVERGQVMVELGGPL
jgi:biotin carboxyl carrier protein